MPAIFKIKRNFQRLEITYEDILNNEILLDICQRLTGQREFAIEWDDISYNKGRLAKLEFEGWIHYISFSFSDIENSGRNSYFQSFPTALTQYLLERNPDKSINFYFLPYRGNIETVYFIFMFRLMKTIGINFLNQDLYLTENYHRFNSISDIIVNRDFNRKRNSGNCSTYASIDETNTLQIFGKTYGANKYETILLSLAFNNVSQLPIEVYEIRERNLSSLPEPGRRIIIDLGIRVITSDITLERSEFVTNDSLRSPSYLYNLLDKLGFKKCCLCDCEIPQIIQGAHIWPVSNIKQAQEINLDRKIEHAINRDNGLWLCNNHHKLFDSNLLFISPDGRLKYKTNIERSHEIYLKAVTTNSQISNGILTPTFLEYLQLRNSNLNEDHFSYIVDRA
ncbi:HNH endonuclease [Sphingobacterium siyangense]|uniref:HNH endonuclease signature motif containing protein n=1 Tax=Sphingobacterium siyangense TaxID=459529 RepID=UPI00200D67D3|nr:HNH endonuclease signature motif containing protein [Sphingobacterium siyangense]UQA76719.1 HNH endonuclease [Sphingobacterium siyangense]